MRTWLTLLLLTAIMAMGLVSAQPAAASTGDGTKSALVVKNTVLSTQFVREWKWNIAKSGSVSELLLSVDQTGSVDYMVMVTGIPQDSGWQAQGRVAFLNSGTENITVSSVVVDFGGGIQVTPTCSNTPGYPPVVLPGYSVVCNYSVNLPDGSPRTSTATITSSAGVVTDAAPVTFGAPVSESGKTIHVDDTLAGVLGTVTGNTNPTVATFQYSYQVGPYGACGVYNLPNTASIRETGQQAAWNVNVNVPCASSCTLTQGYWKTHSQLGPAPYDAAWQNIGPLQEQTVFFLSGATWHQVFWTAPRGNAYYNLAHQYMAAKLNLLDGASSTPMVDAAISFAETFFSTYTPTASLSNSVRNHALAQASVLDQYNNGLIGPGHCTE